MSDSLGRMSMPPLVGTLDRALDSANAISAESLNWIDHRYLGDILTTVPGVFIRDQQSVGQYDQINIRGQDWRSVGVMVNGRVMNDPASGIYNLYHLATEYADRIEVVTGPRAFLYGMNSTGGAVNIVTKNYNSNRPFTKLIYSETGYGYQLSDGTFSQNISRKTNVSIGFQAQSIDGRYPNSAHQAWNVRGKLRFNMSKDLNIICSEYFTSTYTDLNGGVDIVTTGSPLAFIPLQTALKNLDSYEKVTRHDVDVAFVGTFLGDSTNVSTLTCYYSNGLREYRDEENRTAPNGVFIQSDHRSSTTGAFLTQNFTIGFQKVSFGGNFEVRQIEGSPNIGRVRRAIGSAWGKDEMPFGPLTVSGFGRYDRYLGSDYAGAGADGILKLSGNISLFGGGSVSHRMPNYVELFWTDSSVTRTGPIQTERHYQIEAGAEAHLQESGTLRVAYFHRTVEHPILLAPYGAHFVFPGIQFVNGDRRSTNGVEASVRLRVWLLYLEGTGTYIVQREAGGTTLEEVPRLTARGGIYFWNTLLQNHLEIKAGFRGKYASSSRGFLFNAEALSYVQNTGSTIGMGSSVDFFLIGHIGDAYVHLMWENLTNVQYYATPYFPATDRTVRFGIAWEFWN